MKRPKTLSYNETIRFHGHNGPYLALGYRLGRHIVSRFKPKGIMDLRLTVKTRMAKPYTCLIDGLQCSTLATIGKGNLALREGLAAAISVAVRTGKRVCRFEIKKEAMDFCKNTRDLEKAARTILKSAACDLWKVKRLNT